ncbi:hypothetical protein AX17_000511 [Amanita inopinata Kibby_2008]|nr:hypothetical protein AX17_000511 [Amanita inopinata Kibby_2008]
MSKEKYYAVNIGRDAPMICRTWDECKAKVNPRYITRKLNSLHGFKVSRFPGADFKSFNSQRAAKEWLAGMLAIYQCCLTVLKKLQVRATCKVDLCINQPPPPSDPTPPPTVSLLSSDIKLSPEQDFILRRVKGGKSVFFTGSAGTGKSVLLRTIIQHFGGRPSARLGITASTGIAAVNIGGCTLHSWAGIGLGQETAENLAGKFFGQPKLKEIKHRWQDVRTLIIDEISMIDGVLFDKLECVARLMRKNGLPFGGIQLVLSGDFCQLPPVPGRNAKGEEIIPTFAFEADSWAACVGQPINLMQVFRQKDQAFVDMLNAIRFGRTNSKINNAFKQLSRQVAYSDGIEPTELFPTRAEVENANKTRLNLLTNQAHTYNSQDSPGLDSSRQRITVARMERLLDRLVAPKSLILKVGAQVMLIKNLIQGELVNGSLGRVIDFKRLEISDVPAERRPIFVPNSQLWPVVKFTNGRELTCHPRDFTVENASGEMEACRCQVPLILAYALSVHKSQGQTLERVKIDLKRTFEKGQAYVALSRATTMEHLQVLNYNPDKIVAHPRVLEWHGFDDHVICDEFEDEMDSYEAMATYYDF